jgi:hypothetical protein
MQTALQLRWRHGRDLAVLLAASIIALVITMLMRTLSLAQAPPAPDPADVVALPQGAGRGLAHVHIAEHHDGGMLVSFDVEP